MAHDSRLHAFLMGTDGKVSHAAERLRGQIDADIYLTPRGFHVARPATGIHRAPVKENAPQNMMISQLVYGEIFDVYHQGEAWVWGQSRMDDYVGYVAASALEDIEGKPPSTHYLHVPQSLVYREADIKFPPLYALPMGARFAAKSAGRFVELATGGFMIAAHVSPLEQAHVSPLAQAHVSPLAQAHVSPLDMPRVAVDYVAVARQFMDAPYLWGGRTIWGLDCSGLVQLALRMSGFACPRDSDMQAAYCAQNPFVTGQGAYGDLVFWDGHVGLHTGEDKILHANATHMLVTEEDLAVVSARIGTAPRIRRGFLKPKKT